MLDAEGEGDTRGGSAPFGRWTMSVKVTEIVGRFDDGPDFECIEASTGGQPKGFLRDLLPDDATDLLRDANGMSQGYPHGRFRVTVEFFEESEPPPAPVPRYRSSELERRVLAAIAKATPSPAEVEERREAFLAETRWLRKNNLPIITGGTISWRIALPKGAGLRTAEPPS